VLHLHLSGGEPLLREDLPALVAEGDRAGLYVNLITSARGATREGFEVLARAGCAHVQVSLQDADEAEADRVAGVRCHAEKLEAARWVREAGMALSLNVVLHRGNLPRVEGLIAQAEALGAGRLELANTQYHGSAFANRAALLPSREALDRATEVALAARERLRGTMDVLWVLPDWYTDVPKPCMDGWGRRFMTVIPDGVALPCAGAHGLPGMRLDNVKDHSLDWLWHHGEDFARYRGTLWMSEPCRSCERRTVDHGGCRCQAFALTGDPAATDPACRLSPLHHLVRDAREAPREEARRYRLETSRARKA
jgi:pyrroloquinoline quinone biosynthesis protein E